MGRNWLCAAFIAQRDDTASASPARVLPRSWMRAACALFLVSRNETVHSQSFEDKRQLLAEHENGPLTCGLNAVRAFPRRLEPGWEQQHGCVGDLDGEQVEHR